VSDEPQTFTAREIVLEFFPATPARLIPSDNAYAMTVRSDGAREVRVAGGPVLTRLQPLSPHGRDGVQLCCDLCHWSGPRRDLEVLRGEVPGSGGRRFRYVTACRDVDACEARRLDDAALIRLVDPAG
jgi:hypothetical protein